MYKDKPFKMYKIFEEIYYSKSYDSLNTYRNFETVAVPFNKIMLNEYIYYEFKLKYGYKRNGNKHNLNTSENSTLQINNYNNNLFVCDFENMDYFWLCKLYNKKSSVELVK